MDDNTALVAIATITAIPATLSAVFGYLAVRQSKRNSVIMDKVSSQTDGLVTKTLEAERREATANVEIARHEGGDVARKEGEALAIGLLNNLPPTVDVNVVEAVPIKTIPMAKKP